MRPGTCISIIRITFAVCRGSAALCKPLAKVEQVLPAQIREAGNWIILRRVYSISLQVVSSRLNRMK